MSRRFVTTSWTMVLAARDRDSTESRRALTSLCEVYWPPIYAFVRSQGYDAEEARDLTQSYFAELLEKDYLREVDPELGKFRSFVLTSVKHLLSHERIKESRLKRGAGRSPISLDKDEAESRYSIQPTDSLTPEKAFEKQWALTVLQQTTSRLREQFVADGKGKEFDRLRVFLGGRQADEPYHWVGEQLGMTEGAVRTAVHRLRKHFAKTLRAEIAETVATTDEIDEEIRHLRSILAS